MIDEESESGSLTLEPSRSPDHQRAKFGQWALHSAELCHLRRGVGSLSTRSGLLFQLIYGFGFPRLLPRLYTHMCGMLFVLEFNVERLTSPIAYNAGFIHL